MRITSTFFLTLILAIQFSGLISAAENSERLSRWRHQGKYVTFLSNGKIDHPDSDNTWSIQGKNLTLRWKDSNAPNGYWIDNCVIAPDELSYSGKNQLSHTINGVLVWRVSSRWQHQGRSMILYSNSKINNPASEHTWSIEGNNLTLRWKDPKAPGGFWIDKCTISADGLSYTGSNQLNHDIKGTRISFSHESKPTPKPTVAKLSQWEEFQLFAPELSMQVAHYSHFATPVAPIDSPKVDQTPKDTVVLNAYTQIHKAKLQEQQGRDRIQGKAMTDVEARLYMKGVTQLAKDGLEGSITGDEAKQTSGLFGAFLALGVLGAQANHGAKLISDAREMQRKAWIPLAEIAKRNSGALVAKPPLRVEIIVGPNRDRSVRITNISGQTLSSVLLQLRTGLTNGDETFFVFFRDWPKDESKTLSQDLVCKIVDINMPTPYKNAFEYSICSPQLSSEKILLHVPAQRPKLEPVGILGLGFLNSYSYLCLPAPAKK